MIYEWVLREREEVKKFNFVWGIYVLPNQALKLPNVSINSARSSLFPLFLCFHYRFRMRNEEHFALFLEFPSRVTNGWFYTDNPKSDGIYYGIRVDGGVFSEGGKWNWIPDFVAMLSGGKYYWCFITLFAIFRQHSCW